MFKSFDDIAKYYKTQKNTSTDGDFTELVLCEIDYKNLTLMINTSSSFSKNILLVTKSFNRIDNIVDIGLTYDHIEKLTPTLLNKMSIRLANKNKDKNNNFLHMLIKLKNLKKFITLVNLKSKLK